MPMVDTLDKVIGVYMACVCAHPFEYKGHLYEPKPLVLEGVGRLVTEVMACHMVIATSTPKHIVAPWAR